MFKKNYLKAFLILFVLIIISTASYLANEIFFHKTKANVQITIEKGNSIDNITNLLYQRKIIHSKHIFKGIAIFYHLQHQYLQAGEYLLPKGSNMLDLLFLFMNGDVVERRVTLISGHTTNQIVQYLNKLEYLQGDLLNANDYEEGLFLPDTYYYIHTSTRQDIMNRSNAALKRLLNAEWENRDINLPLHTPYEVLILASIVEKEAGNIEEMPIIASVYLNRLKQNMKLQADPTVIYALTKGKSIFNSRVKYKDLKISSPYNTYINVGLPPTPICNPSADSIKAIFHPVQTSYLYFVANGNQGHWFSNTYKEHIQKVAQYKRVVAERNKINDIVNKSPTSPR